MILVGVGLLAIAAGAGSYVYRRHQEQQKLNQVFTPNPQTELGNESKSDADATNTSAQNKTLTDSENGNSQPQGVTNANLPTPLLTKSSGNNGSVPSGAVIEFTCTSQAGYDCAIRLSGPKTINLPKQKLTDNGRGQAVITSDWPAEKGSWTIVAVLSNSTGEKTSATQTLEVK